MQTFLKEIKATPGVLGSSIYTTKKGIIATNLPEVFKDDAQKRIGSILQRIFKLNETVKLDVNSFEIQYDEALLLVKRLCSDSALIIICEPDAKVHLINMTVSMLTTEMLNSMENCEKIPPVQQPQDPEEVLTGPLAQDLALVKRALAKRIGPVAGITLKKAIKEWLKTERPEKSNLKNLIEILLLEIDGNESKRGFVEETNKLIT
ncbi:MAG: hypothetical protein DRH06_04380 [Deltaproteobacteria bacterium]|nr:MAG: hypothetical protein DRH07_04750 [Deltaproteobacteria bacterium]RLB77182.1 MAG: hypothetical protein DRH06_04380 [Deltaproteobacteria bacterium]